MPVPLSLESISALNASLVCWLDREAFKVDIYKELH